MDTEQIVSYIAKGKNAQAVELVKDILYTKAGEALSDFKQEVGNYFFNQEEE
jgi:hypothetical protein